MEFLLGGAVLLVVVVWLFAKNRRPPPSQNRPSPDTGLVSTPSRPGPSLSGHHAAPAPFEPAVIPEAIQAFLDTPVKVLEPAAKAQLLDRLKVIPRPPRALHQLTSPAFLQKAGSTELAELVLSEPQVAAKVLATVNSPLYGLRSPVAHIGQGITFLGLNTVRAICLQYLLNQSFPTSAGELRPAFEYLWKASSLGSELGAKLSTKLGLTDGGALVTQVVLSYLGPMATLTLMPPDQVSQLTQASFLNRCAIERATIGLTGPEVGHLVFREWGLPESVIENVNRMHHVLDTPIMQAHPEQTTAALSYWCARIGERLARGEIPDWESFDWQQDKEPETAIARHYLQTTMGERLTEALKDPVVVQAIRTLIKGQEPPAG